VSAVENQAKALVIAVENNQTYFVKCSNQQKIRLMRQHEPVIY
jgi:hypothetical protein